MNGVFNDDAQPDVVAPVFDPIFACAIGGYPRGALLASSRYAGVMWVSLVDNNTVNPDLELFGDTWALWE